VFYTTVCLTKYDDVYWVFRYELGSTLNEHQSSGRRDMIIYFCVCRTFSLSYHITDLKADVAK